MTVRTNGARTSRVGSGGSSINNGVLQTQGGVPIDSTLRNITDQSGTVSALQLSTNGVAINGLYSQIGPTATYSTGTNTLTHLNLAYTINNTGGTNTITGIKVNATETSITGTTHNLIDLQVGGVSRLRVSNAGNLTVGTSTSITARLGVRGDGTNPIGRFENSAGTSVLLVNNDLSIATGGTLTVASSLTGGFASYTLGFSNPYVNMSVASSSAYGGFQIVNNGNITRTTGETSTMSVAGLFAAAAGSANYKPLNIIYTINNSGAQTGIATGIFLNATETALNSMTHNLVDLRVGNSTKFKIGNTGKATLYDTLLAFASTSGSASINIPTGVAPSAPNDGDIWSDGVNIYMRLGGVTKTFTLI